MVPGSAVRAACVLLFCLGCIVAADVAVAGTGPARSLAQAEAAAVRPESWWRFQAGGVGATCYIWQEATARIRTPWRNNRFCSEGLVCCPRRPFVFPKSGDNATAASSEATAATAGTKRNRWGTYSLGNCRASCDTDVNPEYCCAGPGRCRTPVPRPPSFEQLPPAPANARRGTNDELNAIVKASANAISNDVFSQAPAPIDDDAAETANICLDPTMTRVATPFGTPRADGQAKILITTSYSWPPAAGCNMANGQPYPSPCGARVCSGIGACSGNTISSGLVLMAAHCVAPADFLPGVLQALRANSGYPANDDPCNIAAMPYTINDIVACYNYDNTGGVSDLNRCLPGNTFIANGLSWFNRDPTLPINLRTFDHAIVFLSQAKVLPSYYQYNYLDNYRPTTPVDVENWSYIGNDCATCNVECRLSRIGPAQPTNAIPTGPFLGTGPTAIRLPLTSMPGNSGSCALYSPDGCCIAVSSFSGNDAAGSCGTICNNFYSPIMSTAPLSTLWTRRMRVLPNARM